MSEATELSTTTTPSFVDLRAWAFRTRPLGREPLERQVLPLGPGPVEAGAIRFERGSRAFPSARGGEFIHLIEGELTLETPRGEMSVAAGRNVAIPAGEAVRWRTHTPTRGIYMRYSGGSEAGEGGGLMDPTLPRQPSSPPLAELLVGRTPECRNSTQYKSADGAFSCGVWESTPYIRRAMTYGHHELMHLLQGAVTFEDEHGRTGTFRAGDVVIVRKGARVSWTSAVAVTKVFAIWRPPQR
jgi:uncharacterized cupin superfamily protein